MKNIIVLFFTLMMFVNLPAVNLLEEYIIDRKVTPDGKEIIGIEVPGGRPPVGYVRDQGVNLEELRNQRNIVMIEDVPAFDWSYGCSATSAAMIAAYYDRNGYPNIYTGPTNGGVMPLNNSTWGASSGGEGGDGECPLSATHMGFDGRTTRGHVDDYWVGYGSNAQDPYTTNGWTQHQLGDCTGDYMGTNQKYWSNKDASTTYYYDESGDPLHSYSGSETASPPRKDGGYGFEQFMQSRGYQVSTSYNQYIHGYEGNTLGFTFAQYMAEIDANRPVFIHVVGHTMVGFGYNSSNQTIYLKNTWNYSTHTMTWGGVYSNMIHYAVSVINLSPIVDNGDVEVNFNLSDSYGDGWGYTNGINYIEFRGATITLNSGSEQTFTYHLAPGNYSYTYYENDGWGNENSWSVTLADNTELSSGGGTTSGGSGPASQTYYFTVPVAYSNPLPAESVSITRTGNSALISWDAVTFDIEGTNISAYNVQYRVEMSSDPEFGSINHHITTSGTSYTHTNISIHEKYFYRVIAFITEE